VSDRELLELAAKAAGHRIVEWVQDGNKVDIAIIIRGDGDGFSKRPWQPLLENQMTDADGDALRLAVKLGLTVSQLMNNREVEVNDYDETVSVNEFHEPDPYAATRRAIVRAAAEIGRNMT
jgi:HEAT repeat protein